MIGQASFTTSPRHPVRWFVAVPLVLAAVLLLAWWSGLAAPRLTATGVSRSVDPSGEAVLELRNEGRLPVEVLGASPIGDEVEVAALVSPVRVPGRGRTDARLQYSLVCQSPRVAGPSGVRLHVRTWLGVDRHVDVTDGLLVRCAT